MACIENGTVGDAQSPCSSWRGPNWTRTAFGRAHGAALNRPQTPRAIESELGAAHPANLPRSEPTLAVVQSTRPKTKEISMLSAATMMCALLFGWLGPTIRHAGAPGLLILPGSQPARFPTPEESDLPYALLGGKLIPLTARPHRRIMTIVEPSISREIPGAATTGPWSDPVNHDIVVRVTVHWGGWLSTGVFVTGGQIVRFEPDQESWACDSARDCAGPAGGKRAGLAGNAERSADFPSSNAPPLALLARFGEGSAFVVGTTRDVPVPAGKWEIQFADNIRKSESETGLGGHQVRIIVFDKPGQPDPPHSIGFNTYDKMPHPSGPAYLDFVAWDGVVSIPASIGPRPRFYVRPGTVKPEAYRMESLKSPSASDLSLKFADPMDAGQLRQSRVVARNVPQIQFSVESLQPGVIRLIPKANVPNGDYEIVNADGGVPSSPGTSGFCFTVR
jgi:hypothetical protein